ncbi:uncharacterized protein LOC131329239 [Rhododendron vialii]|uniref:uncharacterized protein LOC131329239 n=1 Tax=Rhododendron vialii TaxID=182163 RepID=UPI00265FD38A|nr:uncharacterized protein LOC131329239 [Rhododendron vialii]
MLYEESGFQKQMSDSGRTIYEWNIDGMIEYQIFGVVHQMMMYNTICVNNQNEDKQVAGWITVGFTGMIKGWWDNVLIANQRSKILNAVKINEKGEQIQDAVYTLVQSIILHFVGHWDNQRERSRELLENLKCPTLTYFRWYKDVFLAKEGLTLCNDIKLLNQLKKQHLTGKQELRQFCDQFGYDTTKYPNISKKKSSNKTTKQYSKRKAQKKRKTTKQNGSKESTLAKKKQNNKSKKKVTTKCFKCEKIGHYANKCKTKKKLNELQIDDELKQLFKLMLNSSDSESQEESDEQINEISDQEDTSSSSEEEEVSKDFVSQYKRVFEMTTETVKESGNTSRFNPPIIPTVVVASVPPHVACEPC